MLGEFTRCMNEILKFQCFLYFFRRALVFKSFRRRGHPVRMEQPAKKNKKSDFGSFPRQNDLERNFVITILKF